MRQEHVLGLILAGGAARRMGGGDKTLCVVAGRTVLARIAERIAPQVGRLALNANGDPGRFADIRLPILPDSVGGRPGPLAGVLAGLEAAGPDDLLSVPGDAPFLPADLAARLRQARERTSAVVAVAASGGRVHPVVALWSPAVTPMIRAALHAGRLKATAFVASLPHVLVEWSADPFDPFLNLNTPADITTAERIIAQGVA